MVQPTPYETLHTAITGYMLSSVLGAAAELDCFTWIIDQGNSADIPTMAHALQLDPRGTGVLLDALAAHGFLIKKGIGDAARYSVPEPYLELLHSRHPDTFVPMLRHMACCQRSWTQLSWSVRDGEPQPRPPSILGAEEDRVSFIQAMHAVALRLVGPTMASLHQAGILSFDVPQPRILDVGGASGTYALALLEAVPGSHVTIFDLPVGIRQARTRFADSAFADRVELVEGDYLRDALPKGHNLAWVSAIIHSLGSEECVRLYQNVHQALVDGGLAVIRDYFMSPDRTSPPAGTLFGVNMLVNTAHGQVYTFEETRNDLERAGFTDVRLAVDVPSMSAIVTGRKG
ncbi:MAG: methyltransferase [Desulfobulbus sp.]|jgi:hypothetical protein